MPDLGSPEAIAIGMELTDGGERPMTWKEYSTYCALCGSKGARQATAAFPVLATISNTLGGRPVEEIEQTKLAVPGAALNSLLAAFLHLSIPFKHVSTGMRLDDHTEEMREWAQKQVQKAVEAGVRF